MPRAEPTTDISSRKWTLVASILGSSMAFIDGTVVNVALPALQTHLSATVSQVQWVVESYALFLAALLLVGGAAGDRYGRRRIFSLGILIFGIASIGCGLAPNIHFLIATRAVQGIGAALLVPGSLALISTAYPAAERGMAIGTWSGFTAITTAIGPVLGGWLVEHASWRGIFFLNVPFAVAVLILCATRVRESRLESHATLDWPGAALATTGLAGVTFALVEGHTRTAAVYASAVIGIACLIAFLLHQARAANPMLPLSLFRSRNFTAANLLTLFLYTALSGWMFFLPLDLIQIEGYSATEAGATLLPFVVLMFLLSRWAGNLGVRFGPRLPLTAGPLLAAAGFVAFALAPQAGSYWRDVLPGVLLLGFGMTVCVAPLTTTVMSAVSDAHAGTASGVNNAVSRLAGLLGVAVFGLLLVSVFNRALTPQVAALPAPVQARVNAQRDRLAAAEISDARAKAAVRLSFINGYRAVLWSAAGLALFSAVTSLALLEHKPHGRAA